MFKGLRAFASAKRGNVAFTFALVIIPVLILIGGATDFNRRENYENDLQAVADAATLAAVRYAIDENATDAEIKRYALNYLASNFDEGASTLTGEDVVFEADGVLRVIATANVPTTILGVIGIGTLEAHALAETVIGGSELMMEAVLVLDVSHSMSGDRIDALKEASIEFTERMLDAGPDVMVGVVPFNHYVNVGANISSSNWLNTPPAVTRTGENCWITEATYRANSCTRTPYTCTNDGIQQTCYRWSCPTNTDSYERTCRSYSYTERFNGSVRSRTPPLNITDGDYASNNIQGIASGGAWVPEILPLTSNFSDIEDHINGLWVSRDTYMEPGISWGVRVLSDSEPFAEGQPFDSYLADGGRKVMVIMSDGENTRSRSNDGYHWARNVDDANEQTRLSCENAKTLGIEIYTIALDVDDRATLDLLEGCATSIDHFQNIDRASQLDDSFDEIALALTEIRLTR